MSATQAEILKDAVEVSLREALSYGNTVISPSGEAMFDAIAKWASQGEYDHYGVAYALRLLAGWANVAADAIREERI